MSGCASCRAAPVCVLGVDTFMLLALRRQPLVRQACPLLPGCQLVRGGLLHGGEPEAELPVECLAAGVSIRLQLWQPSTMFNQIKPFGYILMYTLTNIHLRQHQWPKAETAQSPSPS